MEKRRGAPPGNRNAYKHGFYSTAFKAAEQRLLSEIPAHDLGAEIELIRIGTLRLLHTLNDSPKPPDLATQLSALRAMNLSTHSIVSLPRTQARAAEARQAAVELADLLASEDSDLLAPSGPRSAVPRGKS